MSARSWASGAPLPMAMARCACASTGVSLMPSPTIATTAPADCSAATCACFCCGVMAACTSVMPSAALTRRAASGVSPLSMLTRQPACNSADTISFAPGRMPSPSANAPSQPCSSATAATVYWPRRAAACGGSGWPCSAPANAMEPMRTRVPLMRASMPAPCVSCVAKGGGGSTALHSGAAAIESACATGCTACASSCDASRNSAVSSIRPNTSVSCNCMRPLVRVPVLSNTMWRTCARVSSAWPWVMSMPWRARLPTAADSATGAANESAQGQVTIRTATATHSARCGSSGHHSAAAITASASTHHRNTPA